MASSASSERTERVSTNGTTLSCVVAGDGPLLILLHGFPETAWSWRHQIPALVEAGYRVVAPDLRGFGDSDTHGPFDLATVVADILGLADHFGAAKFALVGHDWGAVVAWALAASEQSRVERLVIINGPHPAVFKRALRSDRRQLKRSWYIFMFQLPWLPERMLLRNRGQELVRIMKAHFIDKTRINDADIEPYRLAMMKPGVAHAMLGWYRAARQRQRIRVGKVSVPTRVIWGMADKSLVYEALVPPLRTLVTDLDVVEIAGAGHFVHEEQPATVTAAILEHLEPGAASSGYVRGTP
jgi:pimeloyl-ACP methyl ester carboxylesterase